MLVKARLRVLSLALVVAAALVAPRGVAAAWQSTTWSTVEVEKIAETPRLLRLGGEIYAVACLHCHGEAGDGEGVGERFLFSKPRDFTSGTFKVRSTSTGFLPTDEDLFRTITTGFPEFGMPRFEYLTPEERWALVYYIQRFSSDFETRELEFPESVGSSPAVTDELVAMGKQLYEDAECWKCHGMEGLGDGESAPDLVDDWGHPSRVAAFALGPTAFKRGPSPEDIVQTFLTGLAGTPMPSYEGVLSDEQAWALAHYVKTLADTRGVR